MDENYFWNQMIKELNREKAQLDRRCEEAYEAGQKPEYHAARHQLDAHMVALRVVTNFYDQRQDWHWEKRKEKEKND